MMATDANCVFCEIVRGHEPAQIVAENDRALALVPLDPVTDGHTLVIPKGHAETIVTICQDDLASVIALAQQVSIELIHESAEGVNILHASGAAAQQSVGHFHLHVVPRHHADGLDLWIRNSL